LRKFNLLISLILFFSIIWPGLCPAQQTELTEQEKAEQLKIQQDVLMYQELETKLLQEAFEQAITASDYIIGPGDYFSVVIWGNLPKGYHLPVTPEGILIVPTIGNLHVDGLSLSEAKSVVKEAAKHKYKPDQISTHLMGMRKIRVHITGDVFKPSSYIATPIDRVSDLIFRAGGLKESAFIQEIKIKHINGQEKLINFSAFQEFGDLEHNPNLKGGDVIIVPQIDFSKPAVRVEGFVSRVGFYPLNPDESLFDFLNRHNLISEFQKITQIQLYRKEEEMRLMDLTSQENIKIILKNGDKLVIPQDNYQVYVSGAVQQPGPYPYIENLLAKDYIGQAGINENASSLGSIQVFHVANGKTEKGNDAQVFPGDIIKIPLRKSRVLSEYFQIAGQVFTVVIAYFAIRRNN